MLTVGFACPGQASAALTFKPGCHWWWAQLLRRAEMPGPLTPVPLASLYSPALVMRWVIRRLTARQVSAGPPRPANTLLHGLPLGTGRKA